MKKVLAVTFLFALTGCGSSHTNFGKAAALDSKLGSADAFGTVVKARAYFKVSTGSEEKFSLMQMIVSNAFAAAVQDPITTVLAPSTNFALDDSLFAVPTSPTPFAINDFGFLRIGTLKDNNLDVCGTNGSTHCGTAQIRIYTSGTPGAGLWNSDDQYGAPITAGQTDCGASLAPVGLEVASATVLQQVAIPADSHVVTLDEFINAKYDFQVDFTKAGAGTYATTVVVEYALAP